MCVPTLSRRKALPPTARAPPLSAAFGNALPTMFGLFLWELFHALPLVVVQPRGCRAVHGSLTGRSRRVWTSYPKAYRVGIATVSRRCWVQQR